MLTACENNMRLIFIGSVLPPAMFITVPFSLFLTQQCSRNKILEHSNQAQNLRVRYTRKHAGSSTKARVFTLPFSVDPPSFGNHRSTSVQLNIGIFTVFVSCNISHFYCRDRNRFDFTNRRKVLQLHSQSEA
jgi:hypothetical protein